MHKQFPNVCIVFDTTVLSGFASDNYLNIRDNIGNLCDLYVTEHSKDPHMRGVRKEDNRIVLSDHAIFSEILHSKDVSRGIIPGNVDLKFIRAARELSTYETIIWYEYDILCTAGIRESFERLIQFCLGFDLLSSYITAYKEDGWVWWDSLRLPKDYPKPAKDVVHRAFTPMLAASQKFIGTYIDMLARGLSGHTEVTVPTCAFIANLQMKDFSQSDHNFLSYPQFNVHSPLMLEKNLPIFIHPVKTADAMARALALRDSA